MCGASLCGSLQFPKWGGNTTVFIGFLFQVWFCSYVRPSVYTVMMLANSRCATNRSVLELKYGKTDVSVSVLMFLFWKWTFSLRGVLTFVASGLDINGCVLSYFEGTANLHCYTSCTLTTLHCSKVSMFVTLQCCHMKRYNKIFTKMWGVYSLLWDTVYTVYI